MTRRVALMLALALAAALAACGRKGPLQPPPGDDEEDEEQEEWKEGGQEEQEEKEELKSSQEILKDFYASIMPAGTAPLRDADCGLKGGVNMVRCVDEHIRTSPSIKVHFFFLSLGLHLDVSFSFLFF